MTGLEQRRRAFKGSDPLLYSYIAHLEKAQALDSVGDEVAGFSQRAANQVWQRAAHETEEARKLSGEHERVTIVVPSPEEDDAL